MPAKTGITYDDSCTSTPWFVCVIDLATVCGTAFTPDSVDVVARDSAGTTAP